MNLFIEICPYHAETLYPLISNNAKENDLALINKNIFVWPLIKAIVCNKKTYTLRKLILLLMKNDISVIYANTVTPNMYPKSLTEIKAGIDMILIPVIARIFGAKIVAVLHEAEFYLPVSLEGIPKRHSLFYALFGRVLSKFYSRFYVLSPEVLDHLTDFSSKLQLLSTAKLSDLVDQKQPTKNSGQYLTWIGSIDSVRRNWEILTEIDPVFLHNSGLSVDLICDINSAEGPLFLDWLDNRPEYGHTFNIRNHRPDDIELLTAAQQGYISLCFYSNKLYGKTKTSGARHIALAFDKPTITSYPNGGYVLFNGDGSKLVKTKTLKQCLEFAMQELHSKF